jgi:hypothetical protein
VTAIQIETAEAVRNCDEIAAVDGADLLFMGPADSSHNMGIRDQLESPQFLDVRDGECGGAALPNLPYALDTKDPWQWEDIVVGGRMKCEGGCVALPKEPVLGVELDRAALARAHAG